MGKDFQASETPAQSGEFAWLWAVYAPDGTVLGYHNTHEEAVEAALRLNAPDGHPTYFDGASKRNGLNIPTREEAQIIWAKVLDPDAYPDGEEAIYEDYDALAEVLVEAYAEGLLISTVAI